MTTHELKTWPENFDPLITGKKRAELRRNDRPFKVDDWIKFREYDPKKKEYTGNTALAVIIHIADSEPIPEGFVLLSIAPPHRVQ